MHLIMIDKKEHIFFLKNTNIMHFEKKMLHVIQRLLKICIVYVNESYETGNRNGIL
jgi:hypothetical protein